MGFLPSRSIRLPALLRFLFRLRDSLFLAVNLHEFLAGDGFLLDQICRDLIQDRAVLAKQRQRLVVTLLQDTHDFGIHLGGGHIGAVHHRPSLQILALHCLKPDQAELLAHAVLRHHRPGNARRLLDIIGSSCGHGVKYDLLRRTAGQQADKHRMQLRFRIQVFLFLRHLHHIAQRAHGPGYDRDLLHGLRVLLQGSYQRMTHFMVGYDAPLFLAHDTVFLFLTNEHLLHSLEQVLLADVIPALLDRVDGGFIDHIGKIGTHSAAGRKRDGVQVYGVVHQHILGVHLEDLHTPLQVRLIHNDLPVKTAGTQQRLVQDLRTVRRAQDQDPAGAVEAVHFAQKLVQRLFPLLISAAILGITASADSIDLIDKNDTRRVFGRFLEQVAHTGRAHAHIQFNKIRTGQGEKRHMRFSGNRLCQKRFTGSGRTYEQRALGKLRADLGIPARIVQEIHDLL